MFEEYQICPYTGLRSFTEEESLYFKGREEHIQSATEQLQQNKFLMLTGASGDGKSSLVYAGIIPNARAGFLKSKYTNWCVADFRPERSPFVNLSKAIARQLEISNYRTVESELHHGFSALTDLYRNSKRYVDVDSNEWQQADDLAKAAIKREAGNLIILVDQFEEFFTNPENYHRGVPSKDSNLVLNLLLETARIALEEDLPIYVIFTMRSDFIGQCAAFRGLPEYIGFSQFFVPRLNRSQLQQVIEEPAVLSGNKISRRLAERLIHDVAEGVDQLPILQHALNQVWHAANRGTEEMDLIHYAMVGGMPAKDLPDEQIGLFKNWFDKLPEKVKACYHKPSLQNVLDTHANKLFESAAESYMSRTGKDIPDEAAKEIIKKTFICLTKIDQSRAVRNRMTLREIGHIVNVQGVDVETMGWVLNIFREPGNTFVRPFITDEVESGQLKDDDVLDITHESLIRNWELLEEWAKEEFHDYSVYLDFEQQLNRWVESDKSNGFLLSIGPLTYFENWYEKVKPNAWWIARYLPEDIEQDKKLIKAKQVLANAQEFLKRSARKHAITRAFIRYGTKRIGFIAGIIAVLILSSFAVRDFLHKQNTFVLESIKEETLQLADNKKVTYSDKIVLLIEELKLGEITLREIMTRVQDPVERLNVISGIPMMLVFQGRDEPKKEIAESLALADSLMEAYPMTDLNLEQTSGVLKELNDFGATLDVARFYNKAEYIKELKTKNAKRQARWVLNVIETQPAGFDDIRNFSVAIENSVNNAAFTQQELDLLIKELSPFEETPMNEWHQALFKKDKIMFRGIYGYGFAFNGLYQELAYLYAARGDFQKTLQCVDSLLHYNDNYFGRDYSAMLDNAVNIASVFYLNDKEDEVIEFVNGYCKRKGITEPVFYEILGARYMNNIQVFLSLHLHPFMNATSNLNLRFTDPDQVRFFSKKHRESILKSSLDINTKNFQLALAYKNEAMFVDRYSRGYNDPLDKALIWPIFDNALSFYKQVDPKYLERDTDLRYQSDVWKVPMKIYFIYPDFISSHNPTEPRQGSFYYTSDSFMKYILEKGYFDSFYQSDVDLRNLNYWMLDYNWTVWNPPFSFLREIDYRILAEFESKLKSKNTTDQVDLTMLYFHLGRKAYLAGDTAKVVHCYKQIKNDNMILALRDRDNNIRFVADAIINLVRLDHFGEAYKLIQTFKSNINRSNIYAFASIEFSRSKEDRQMAIRLIDSARVEMNRVKELTTWQPNRMQLAYAMTMVDPEANNEESYRVIKNISQKSFAQMRIARSYAFNNQLYGGVQNIPEGISNSDRTVFLWSILYGYQENMDRLNDPWTQYKSGHRPWFTKWLAYVDDDE